MADFVPRHTKIVQSGDLIEVYEYEKAPPVQRFRGKRRRRYRPFKSERHIMRTKFNFTRKVRTNLALGTPHLITLTMLSIVDIAAAYKEFTQFGVRLRKVFGKDLVWITVPEFQKRGAVHFHCLIWGLPYDIHKEEPDRRRIQHLWGYGYVDCALTDGSPKLSGYLAKYMSKAMHDDRLVGKKAYSCSRHTLSSVSLNTPTQIAFFTDQFSIDTMTPTKEKEHQTKWLGRVRYRRFEGTIDDTV